jgi:hypothetical protein
MATTRSGRSAKAPVHACLGGFCGEALHPVRSGEFVAQFDVRALLEVMHAALADDRPAGLLGHGPLAETVPGLVAELSAEPDPSSVPGRMPGWG